MAKLEIAVQEQFAAGKAVENSASNDAPARAPGAEASADSSSSSSAIEPPFAKVNSVAPNSPADRATLKPGDKVLRFGSVNWTNHERLSQVARVVQQNENVRYQTRNTQEFPNADDLYSTQSQ